MSDDTWCEIHQRNHPPRRSPCRPVPEPTFIGQQPHTEVVDTSAWRAADDYAPVEAVEVLADVRKAAKRIDPLLDDDTVTDVLERMATWGDDTIRAASTAPAGGQPMWCEVHDCDTHDCPTLKGVRTSCGEHDFPYYPGVDPAGERAAQRADRGTPRALLDRTKLLGLFMTRARLDRQIAALIEGYSTRPGVGRVVVDNEWCACCQRDAGYCEPIARHTDRRPRYRAKGGGYLCRWCGGFASSYGVEPPLAILKLRHEGRKITTAQVAAALPKKSKKRRR